MRTLARCPLISATTAIACLALLGFSETSSAKDVVSIEEHWELKVGGPDAGRSAPQVSLVMSPTGTIDGDFFVFTINHWSYPHFSPGGLQVQHWSGAQCHSSANDEGEATLSQDGETITWVQRLQIEGESLTFEIADGSSNTWGSFGDNGQLKRTIGSSLTRLNQYRPSISIEESGIGYAGNRVSSLTLKKLVWTTSDGEQQQLIAPIDIATQLDP